MHACIAATQGNSFISGFKEIRTRPLKMSFSIPTWARQGDFIAISFGNAMSFGSLPATQHVVLVCSTSLFPLLCKQLFLYSAQNWASRPKTAVQAADLNPIEYNACAMLLGLELVGYCHRSVSGGLQSREVTLACQAL